MCILFIYIDPNPNEEGYRLILASNRDEYYERPAAPAKFCPETKMIGGRDMLGGREGGMWLGASVKQAGDVKFRTGVLLNVTGEERNNGVKGRGSVVTEYLKNDYLLEEYVENVLNINGPYNAFNFVTVELSDANAAVSHHSNKQEETLLYQGKQTLSFGNSNPQSPLTKVTKGKDAFQRLISRYNSRKNKDELVEELLLLLKWDQQHLPDPELQRRAPEGFQYLSSVFVKVEAVGYGTRTHTIILVDKEWNVEFIESTMQEPIDVQNPKWNTQTIKSRL